MLSTSFFVLLLQLPPVSTLFPYTTLFRSGVFLHQIEGLHDRLVLLVIGVKREDGEQLRHHPPVMVAIRAPHDRVDFLPIGARSEEHTSELQSRFDLVCRLLLEKKKSKTIA